MGEKERGGNTQNRGPSPKTVKHPSRGSPFRLGNVLCSGGPPARTRIDRGDFALLWESSTGYASCVIQIGLIRHTSVVAANYLGTPRKFLCNHHI
jgi:hypothetical protein